MAASAGVAPWSEGFRRATKPSMKASGVEWSFSSGYRQKQDWDKKPKKPKTKKVKLYNGRVVEVPDADFEDFIGHQRSPPSSPETEVGKYIDKAFENMDAVQDCEGCGHIALIEYVPRYQVLRVEFETDGAVVVFFRVPKEVYSELKYLADSKQTAISTIDGKQRHVLGMKFWDIVRIRGQLTGSRYRYEYAIEGERRGTQFNSQMARDEAEFIANETSESKLDSSESLYDGYAKNFLTGSKRDDYNKLKTLKEKQDFLRKAGIL